MAVNTRDSGKRRKYKKPKKSKIVSFDEEVITKDDAEKMLMSKKDEQLSKKKKKKKDKMKNIEVTEIKEDASSETHNVKEVGGEMTEASEDVTKVKKMKNKRKNKESELMDDELQSDVPTKKKKRNKIQPEGVTEMAEDVLKTEKSKKKRKNKDSELISDELQSDPPVKKKKQSKIESEESVVAAGDDEVDSDKPNAKKKESIRERKRKKYAKLLEDKKIQGELAMQQKSLNYLSKWKYSKQDWKFEKLRQVWLQQSMFDVAKIPNEFWDILVEYFSNSKGQARASILKEALKFIDRGENTEELEGDDKIKFDRARDIVQNLEE